MGDERAGMVKVPLNQQEWEQHAERLASLENQRTAVEEKKATHNRAWNEELKQLYVDIKVEAEAVESHEAWVPAQAGMFDEDGVANDAEPDEEAEAAPKRGRRGRRGSRSEASANA